MSISISALEAGETGCGHQLELAENRYYLLWWWTFPNYHWLWAPPGLLYGNPSNRRTLYCGSSTRSYFFFFYLKKFFLYKQGPPNEILTNNDTTFTYRSFINFLKDLRVWPHLWYAYTLSRNKIVERCHWSMKTFAARKQCTGIDRDNVPSS